MSMTAASAGLLGCRTCGLLNRRPAARTPARQRFRPQLLLLCVRCGTALHTRKPYSIARTWALVIAAYVLYLPANLLPIVETGSLGKEKDWDTIIVGVIKLWQDGWWPLSVVILIASIAIPLGKLLALTYLLICARRGSATNRRGPARLYRLIEVIGKWSMVDIYALAILVALVQFQPAATVAPGPGAIAFGAVVVLTMLASRSFDPRLLWDSGGFARLGHG